MLQSIENPADCEIRSVIRFFNAKDVKAAEIHRQITEVYEKNIVSEGMVRKWVRAFKDGRAKCVMKKEAGDLLSLLKTWYRKLMQKFERTEALRFHLYRLSFFGFQEVFLMELCDRALNLS
ncbi:hypothetical protein AVEN_25100-1 [Araneus ventricosus]|uniref:Mos1 transposase HTH domain-containing protein n=1 Tax=Araneus ventricosus TaxID=182803 RepID=A0A4Y2JF57_ARAVE|nr:hypothetical protein AVEN_25100-1 [Araneus ventricosus]